MGIKYELPEKVNSNMFFARRVRKWLLNPDGDKELDQDIREGKYPELECLLPENNGDDIS